MIKYWFPKDEEVKWDYDSTFYHQLMRRRWLNAIGEKIGRSDMNGLGGAYPVATQDYDKPQGQLSVRKELDLEVVRLEKELQIKKELQKLLDENPVIEKFMDLSRGIL